VRVVQHPPHAVIAAAGQRLVAGGGELLAVAAATDVVHEGLGHDLHAVELPVEPHRLAEARQIPQRHVQAAAAELDAGTVDQEVGILLGAELGEDPLAQELRQRLAGDAAQHPRQRVGVRCLVDELRAVLPGLGQRGQIRVRGGRTVVARRNRQKSDRPAEIPHRRVLVGVVLRVVEPGGHVEELPDGGVAEGAALQLGHVAPDGGTLVESALRHQDAGQRGDERLGDRERDVLPLGRQRAAIAFVDDPATVQDDDAVGVVRVEGRRPRQRRAAADRRECHRIEIAPLGARQRRHRTRAARDGHRRHQLAHVREGPARPRELVEAAVGKQDELAGRWRRPVHPPERDGIGRARIGKRGRGALRPQKAHEYHEHQHRGTRRQHAHAHQSSRQADLKARLYIPDPSTASIRSGPRSGSTQRARASVDIRRSRE